jgi:2-phosphoglycolate phosphatase
MTILFDLDGTLLDTSHDIIDAANNLLIQEKRAPVSYDYVRPIITFGGKKIIAHAFGLQPELSATDHQYIEELLPRFMQLYKQTNFQKTVAFPGINELLAELESLKISWGIVTNKIQELTIPLLQNTGYLQRSACLVCGDTTKNIKPHPGPLHHACDLLDIRPETCLYIGDSETDIQAGKAAGMKTMAVSFGYIPPGVSVTDWESDYLAHSGFEILPWIRKWSEQQA